MVTYLYCVLHRATAEPVPSGLRGVAGEPVRTLSDGSSGSLEAWVGTLEESELRVSGPSLARRALRHNEVVNAALDTGRTPIPARFGSHFEDDAACVRDIATRRDELLETLHRVAGAVEHSVLVLPVTPRWRGKTRPNRAEAGAGRAYLESVRARVRDAESRQALVRAEADRVSTMVARFVVAEIRTLDQRGIISLAHLVSREAQKDYRATVAEIRAEEGVRIVCGPVRAPYSFAELRAPETGHDSSSPNRND